MLLYSDELRQAHFLKERFYKISNAKSFSEAREFLKEWIDLYRKNGIKEYISWTNTLNRWFKEIINSFDVPYTNGCIKGFNNKIKVIKRNAFGFRNFKRFRNRILHCCR
ncbi:transposase [Caloramator fervidus]|uniref:transposase n=1 Tax=Caloramator fervidus TaxID=29344 RepID=UPI001A9A50CD|nr:transposase [Caloramator fervidus]